MTRKIIFVAGIHGVGKSTLCEKLVTKLNIPCYSSSDLINRLKKNTFTEDKAVANVFDNQDILLSALKKFVDKDRFLLDGHFALFNSHHEVQLVPEQTFKSISPVAICVLTCDAELALKRVETRDKVKHSISAYKALSATELTQAKEIAAKLSVPLFIHNTNNDTHELIRFISSHLE